MKKTIFKRMKKQIAVFASVLLIAVTGLVYVSCTSDDFMSKEEAQAKADFEEDLLAFNNQQQQLLASLEGTRAGENMLTLDEVAAVGVKLGENMDKFALQHADYLQEFAPKQTITEDEFEMMKLDPDMFLDYVQENSSEDLYNILADKFSKEDESIDLLSIDISKAKLNPLEEMGISNLAVMAEFEQVYGKVVKPDQPIVVDKVNVQKCHAAFKQDMKDCAVVAGIIGVGGTILSWTTGILGPGGTAASWKAAAAYFTTCTIAAARAHDVCMGSNLI